MLCRLRRIVLLLKLEGHAAVREMTGCSTRVWYIQQVSSMTSL